MEHAEQEKLRHFKRSVEGGGSDLRLEEIGESGSAAALVLDDRGRSLAFGAQDLARSSRAARRARSG